jgi:hypothetical protein
VIGAGHAYDKEEEPAAEIMKDDLVIPSYMAVLSEELINVFWETKLTSRSPTVGQGYPPELVSQVWLAKGFHDLVLQCSSPTVLPTRSVQWIPRSYLSSPPTSQCFR